LWEQENARKKTGGIRLEGREIKTLDSMFLSFDPPLNVLIPKPHKRKEKKRKVDLFLLSLSLSLLLADAPTPTNTRTETRIPEEHTTHREGGG